MGEYGVNFCATLRRMKDAQDTDSTRQRCLDQALNLLLQGSVESLSLRAVARAAGLSATAPYRHFESKEAMLAELATRGFLEFEMALRSASPGGVHLMTLDSFCEMGICYVQFAQAQPAYYQLMFGTSIADPSAYPALDEAAQAAFSVLLQSIEVLQRVGEIRPAPAHPIAAHVWSVCHGFSALLAAGKFSKVDGLVGEDWQSGFRAQMDILLDGLRPAP